MPCSRWALAVKEKISSLLWSGLMILLVSIWAESFGGEIPAQEFLLFGQREAGGSAIAEDKIMVPVRDENILTGFIQALEFWSKSLC